MASPSSALVRGSKPRICAPMASTAASRATQGLTPRLISRAHTAPPVAREPSTVRSATSRMR